jgi:hypothetical protein
MYLFETCPFKELSGSGEPRCFEAEIPGCVKRHRDTIRNYCTNNFTRCPYYEIQGLRDRFGGKIPFRWQRAR